MTLMARLIASLIPAKPFGEAAFDVKGIGKEWLGRVRRGATNPLSTSSFRFTNANGFPMYILVS